MMQILSGARVLALALALGAMAACNRDAATDDTAGGDVAPPSTAAPAPANAELRVNEVRLGRVLDAEGRVSDETDDFGLRDTIRVSVRTEGTAQNATITARWMFGDQLVDSTSHTVSPTNTAYTHFFIAKPDAWPAGDYRVVILVNGREVQTKDFDVEQR